MSPADELEPDSLMTDPVTPGADVSPPPRRSHRLLVIGAFVVLLLALTVALGLAWSRFGDDGSPSGSGGTAKTVSITPGMNAQDVAALLVQEGIVAEAGPLLARMQEAGVDASIKAGQYTFKTGDSLDAVIAALASGGSPLSERITVPEGLAIDQAAKVVSEDPRIDATEYARLAREPSRQEVPSLPGTPGSIKDLEGFLFPSTYDLPQDAGAGDLIRQQLEAFTRQTRDLPWNKADQLGLTPYQVLTVASLIEKEVKLPEERAKVAAVIYNRLAKDMPLGIDATTRYALGKWTGPLTESDLAVDSPYNTRDRKGLPPGPISSPGLAALEAALDPAQVDYLYYVLTDDTGRHFFTSSYEEFLQAKKRAETP